MRFVSGEEILEQTAVEFPELPVIILTGKNEVESAVECMRKGAFDYMVKPVDRSRLLACVRRATAFSELQQENERLRRGILAEDLRHSEAFKEIITQDEAMRAVCQYVEAVAGSSQPVLITGETGVGKELFAHAIHRLSGRTGPFAPVNVAGLDDNMFSDALFGHRRGAFTGADSMRQGLIEQAENGTLFLDEIGDLSLASQVKLLRLLEDGEYLPLGSDLAKRSSARIVVATNRDLCARQEAGAFRKDLFYRLHTHHVRVPPLRKRPGDVPLLLEHFLHAAGDELKMPAPTPPPELAKLLAAYSFPGNVRELRAMVFDAVSRHRSGILSMESFRRSMDAQGGSARLDNESARGGLGVVFPAELPTIKDATKSLIGEALRRSGGNQTLAARMLGITQQALSRRLKRSRE
jgi:DNA-binding NtrC family response regulator